MTQLPSQNPSETNRILRIQRIQACVRQANAEARKEPVKSLQWIKWRSIMLFNGSDRSIPDLTEEEFWREQDKIMGSHCQLQGDRTMNSKEQCAYLKACENYSHSKWALIRLSNLADAMSCNEIEEIHDRVFTFEISQRQARYDKLMLLGAPSCIMKREEKVLNDIKRGMGPLTRSLVRSINRRNKEIER